MRVIFDAASTSDQLLAEGFCARFATDAKGQRHVVTPSIKAPVPAPGEARRTSDSGALLFSRAEKGRAEKIMSRLECETDLSRGLYRNESVEGDRVVPTER